MPARRLTIFVLAVTAGTAALFFGSAWKPLSGLDRQAFQAVQRDRTEVLIEGNGSREAPWSRRPITAPTPQAAPKLLALTDDPERVFESSPHSAADWGVIFYNLARLGKQPVAIAAPLSWSEADPVSRAAAETQLKKLTGVVLAAPLTRKIQPQPLPPAFERTSVPLSHIQGDTSLLPQVNDTSIPNLVLQGGNVMAGFTHIDSESITPYADHASDKETRLPLLARWGDHVVFAWPLVAIMMRDNVSPEQLVIIPGHHLRVGVNGAILPLDAFGTTPLPSFRNPAAADSVETLIDAETPAALPEPALQLIRDERTSSPAHDRALAAGMADVIALMDHAPRPGHITIFLRLPLWAEVLLVANFAAILAWFAHNAALYRVLLSVVLMVALVALLVALVQSRTLWSPPLPYLITILIGLLASFLFSRKRPVVAPKETPAS